MWGRDSVLHQMITIKHCFSLAIMLFQSLQQEQSKHKLSIGELVKSLSISLNTQSKEIKQLNDCLIFFQDSLPFGGV